MGNKVLAVPTGWIRNKPETMIYGAGGQTSELQLARFHTQNSTLLDRPYTETNGPVRSQWDYGLEGVTEDLTGHRWYH